MSNAYCVASRWCGLSAAIVNKKRYPLAFDRAYIGRLRERERESNAIHIRKRRPVKEDDGRLKNYFLFEEPLSGIYLTRRESQVLYLICHGLTNKEVAKKMGLSARTTEYYIKNIREKTATTSKQNLIFRIIETDFLKRVDSKKLFSGD